MHTHLIHPLNHAYNMRLNSTDLFSSQAIRFIPTEWRLILLNSGSFTQNLNSLTGYKVKACMAKIKNKQIIKQQKLRSVYLANYWGEKLAFARSLWEIEIEHKTNIILIGDKPMGQSLIEHQTDIYKDVHEIYWTYSACLEHKFKSVGPIWGRKYTLYCQDRPFVTIQEFFSPCLINLFNYKKI